MLASTPGLVLHTTPYSESSVVVRVFTRQFGVKAYIIKGVRGHGGRVKQNMLQPLSCLDMVVYDSHRTDLNHVKELSPRHPSVQAALPSNNQAISNALRFFMTEVLYKALREEEPMPELWDYVEAECRKCDAENLELKDLPIVFMLTVARHLGVEPLDNYSLLYPLFDLQEGRYVSTATETTLSPALSAMLHEYLSNFTFHLSGMPSAQPTAMATDFMEVTFTLTERRSLIDALLAYYQLHLSCFRNFNSHEILHTILK